MARTDIRLALPSKGKLQEGSLEFLDNCGLQVFRPNPRQYAATIPNLSGVTVLFQRPGDIVVGVREGTVDFGVTGLDMVAEKGYASNDIIMLHDALGFGPCTLNLAVPESLPINTMSELAAWATELETAGKTLRVATKFPQLTRDMLLEHNVQPYRLISPEGTLEIAPAIGFADVIADLVSSGITLRDNHLRPLEDGLILRSEACLIANKTRLREREDVLAVARIVLEFTEAYQRAQGSYQITANMRGRSPQEIAQRMFQQTAIGGLQGPTIAPVIARENLRHNGDWFAVNIIVAKTEVFSAVNELRRIGGSGVIVTPCAYIFEEEPTRYRAMLAALENET
ncbi:MAG: ATP phosphoribosyltransferase [Candidatus Promineifilaceae bacterium]